MLQWFTGKKPDLLPSGETAPDFNLPSTDGGNLSLGDLRGRWAVLAFYLKDNTPG
ncbi:redoxin domain-containing protein [candidate division GN15 bacterium]|nr:redoxin domain-containing protein [candidate division GN15 bacterium]